MGGGGGYGHLTRSYSGGYFSGPGFSRGLFHSAKYDMSNESADKIFETHANNIKASNDEKFHLNGLKDDINDALSKELKIRKINVIGSTTKNTQVKNRKGNDIDIMVELDEKEHGEWLRQDNGTRNSLEKVKRVLQKDPRFKNVEMHVDRNVVTVEVGNQKADIIPSFPDGNGANRIPDTSKQKWISTNPRLSTRLYKAEDKRNNYKLSELSREIKYWNQKNGGHLSSHHIDCMAYDYFKRNKPKDGENTLRVNTKEFLERMPWYLKRHVRDSVSGERADTYLTDAKRQQVISNAQESNKILRNAEKEAKRGNTRESDRLYRDFLGEHY